MVPNACDCNSGIVPEEVVPAQSDSQRSRIDKPAVDLPEPSNELAAVWITQLLTTAPSL
jgi:hypothetical protein